MVILKSFAGFVFLIRRIIVTSSSFMDLVTVSRFKELSFTIMIN